jgi:hypothetical protein
MREINNQTPTQKMRSPFVAKVIFWNKSKYQNRYTEWNFRSDMCPNITKNSTIREHLDGLIKFLKSDILRNYGFELCTIFENMNFLTQYDGQSGIKKNIVLQCSEHSLYYDNRGLFDFDNVIKNNEFYISETWNEEVMMVKLDKSFIARMQQSFKEQADDINYTVNKIQNVYKTYRNSWQIECKNDMKLVSI